MSGSDIEWDSIEIEYLTGSRTVLSIANEYGCTEGSIRRRAKANGWIRNPTKAKREQVKARLASVIVEQNDTNSNTIIGQDDSDTSEKIRSVVRTAIDAEISADVSDMNLGVANARAILVKCSEIIPSLKDSRDMKAISETNKINIEIIRKIRGLDEERNGSYEDDLAELAAGL